jgi:hypothetical protein
MQAASCLFWQDLICAISSPETAAIKEGCYIIKGKSTKALRYSFLLQAGHHVQRLYI